MMQEAENSTPRVVSKGIRSFPSSFDGALLTIVAGIVLVLDGLGLANWLRMPGSISFFFVTLTAVALLMVGVATQVIARKGKHEWLSMGPEGVCGPTHPLPVPWSEIAHIGGGKRRIDLRLRSGEAMNIWPTVYSNGDAVLRAIAVYSRAHEIPSDVELLTLD